MNYVGGRSVGGQVDGRSGAGGRARGRGRANVRREPGRPKLLHQRSTATLDLCDVNHRERERWIVCRRRRKGLAAGAHDHNHIPGGDVHCKRSSAVSDLARQTHKEKGNRPSYRAHNAPRFRGFHSGKPHIVCTSSGDAPRRQGGAGVGSKRTASRLAKSNVVKKGTRYVIIECSAPGRAS